MQLTDARARRLSSRTAARALLYYTLSCYELEVVSKGAAPIVSKSYSLDCVQTSTRIYTCSCHGGVLYYGVWRIRFFSKMPCPSSGRAAYGGWAIRVKTTTIRSRLIESELLPGLHPSRIPVQGTLDFSFFDEILHRTFIFVIAFNIAIGVVSSRSSIWTASRP